MPHRCGRFRDHALPRSRPVLPISPVAIVVVVAPIPPVVATVPIPHVTAIARLVVAIVPERPPVMAVPRRDGAELRRNRTVPDVDPRSAIAARAVPAVVRVVVPEPAAAIPAVVVITEAGDRTVG